MSKIKELLTNIKDVATRYGLEIYYTDFTSVTLITRFGITPDIFIQLYANTKKEKLNMALIVSGNRIYGIDKEGGFYHEHPFNNPESHIKTEPVGLEKFVIKSLEYLERLGFI